MSYKVNQPEIVRQIWAAGGFFLANDSAGESVYYEKSDLERTDVFIGFWPPSWVEEVEEVIDPERIKVDAPVEAGERP